MLMSLAYQLAPLQEVKRFIHLGRDSSNTKTLASTMAFSSYPYSIVRIKHADQHVLLMKYELYFPSLQVKQSNKVISSSVTEFMP